MSRILIVEDDAEFGAMVAEWLDAAGHTAHTTLSAEDALRTLGEETYDVIIADLNLHGDLDGLGLCERVAAAHSDVPVIVMTAFGSLELDWSLLFAGIAAASMTIGNLVAIAQSKRPDRKAEGQQAVLVDAIPAEVRSLNFTITSQGSVEPRTETALVAEVSGMLDAFLCPDLPGCNGQANGVFHLLGTSGTVTTLAGVHLNLPRYDRRRVDGLWLSNNEVDLMMQKLLSWDFDQRSSNPCIGADRADLVLAGCAILEAIRRRWPSERLRVADRGLREGLLTEMMAADGIWRRGKNRRSFYRRDRNHRNGGREASKADN